MAVNRNLTIGRVAGNDIVIPDSAVSRQHARIQAMGNGMSVVDLGSLNGVFLNGERISDEQVLQDGDLVRIGRTLITASIPEEVAEAVPEPEVEPSERTVAISADMSPVAEHRPESAETILPTTADR